MHASRRKISLSILLLLALCLLPACLLADADGFTFSGENNSILTKYTGTEADIVIPDHVKRIAAQAFADNKAVQNVTFPDTLEAIETGAFRNSGLTSVIIPDGVRLGRRVFSGSDIQSAVFEGSVFCLPIEDEHDNLPEDICAIPKRTFEGCKKLSTVTLPATLKIIDSNAFERCEALKSIDLPEGLTFINNGVFSYSGLTEIHIPGSVHTIKQGVFQACSDLKNVILEEGITSISNAAFSFSGLERITFPESMEVFDSQGIFADTNNLMVIRFLNRNPQFTRGEDFFGDYEPLRDGIIDPTIYGYRGTQAEALAKKENLVFVPLEEENGEKLDKIEDFDSLSRVDVPTILVPKGQDGDLTYEINKNANNQNTIVYNVHLRDEYDGKPETLKEECILCFPYPEGLDENSRNKYRIIIHHYAGNGKTEVFKSENGDIEFTKQGLCIRVSSFSPFEITWETGQDLPQTGDPSALGLYAAMCIFALTALAAVRRRKTEN